MGVYSSLETKWYNTLEKIDSKVKIFWLVDKVDAVIPSFLLFLIVILLVIVLFSFLYLDFEGLMPRGAYEATFVLKSQNGEIIKDSVIQIKILENGEVIDEFARRTDDVGKITLTGLSRGQEVNLKANLTKGILDVTFTIDDAKFFQEINLKAPAPTPIDRRIITRNELGMTITTPVSMTFYCENSAVSPTPTSGSTINGAIDVVEPLDCTKLYAKVIDSAYEQKTYYINSKSFEMRLSVYTPPEVNLKVKIRYNDFPVSDASFNVTLSGQESYTGITNNSETIISVLPGTYQLSVSNSSGKYATTTKQVSVTENRDEYVNVTKEILTRINVKTVDGATGFVIEDAIVSLKKNGREIQKAITDEDGKAVFALTETGTFTINAKKPGDAGIGYFSKEVTMSGISGDVNTEIRLEAITQANAGRTSVLVIDQDNEPVANAKVMLKYEKDDTIVELNQQNNYAITDVNGYVELLAGKVEGKAYASMLKYPFSGESSAKIISIDQENSFEIKVDIGYTNIKIYATDETGENVNGEAELFEMNNEGVSGLISIEDGEGGARIKAGRTVYLAVRSNEHELYYSEPIMLWPSTSISFNVKMKTEINEPAVKFEGIYNDQDKVVRTMKAGSKYYAIFAIESDASYNEVMFNFRAGLEKLLENDYVEIDTIESAMISSELRGTSYNPEVGYSYDSENTTASLAKWASVYFNGMNTGIRKIKVNFKVKTNTPSNKTLQFFWKARFDDIRKPDSTESEDLYADAYATDVYYVGEESTCDTAFCVISEWLYDERDELYIGSPYTVRQVFDYTYHYQIINNSSTDFGTDTTKIVLGLENLSQEGTGIKVVSYQIKGPGLDQSSSSGFTKLSGLEIPSFEKNTAIDITLKLQGSAPGNGAIATELKSEGQIVFSDQEGFSVPNEEAMQVTISPTFIPAMLDTEIIVNVADSKGEPVPNATVKVYARQPGFTKYVVYESTTSRLGKALVYSGSHFTGTEVQVEVSKEEYSKSIFKINVSDDVVVPNPDSLAVTLNTIDPRETTKSVEFGNATGETLIVSSISTATDFEGVINESALNSYFEQIVGTELAPNDIEELDILRIKLDASLSEDTMIEPIDITGDIIISFRVKGTGIIYDTTIPLSLYVSSSANTAAKCLIMTDATQSKTTEKGKVYFYFELTNACQTETGADVPIDTIYAKLNTSDIKGSAEISLQSYNSTSGGRSAIDGLEREVYSGLAKADKLAGTLAYSPDSTAVGETINITASLTGKFQDQTINTDPTTLNFTVNVINLKECVTIEAPTGTVDYDSEASITIDATKCLGQKIEITLCKEDSGCSGDDASGTVSLSNRDFVLENTTETISVYSPTYPGAYGISVWARVKGTSSYSYIGEAVAKFNEDEGKYFELSKFDFYLVGDGATDVAVLENSLLTQNVKINADYCVWGEEVEDPTIGEYLTAAGIGLTIGNTIGSSIGSNFDKSNKADEITQTQEQAAESITNQENAQDQIDKTQAGGFDGISENGNLNVSGTNGDNYTLSNPRSSESGTTTYDVSSNGKSLGNITVNDSTGTVTGSSLNTSYNVTLDYGSFKTAAGTDCGISSTSSYSGNGTLAGSRTTFSLSDLGFDTQITITGGSSINSSLTAGSTLITQADHSLNFRDITASSRTPITTKPSTDNGITPDTLAGSSDPFGMNPGTSTDSATSQGTSNTTGMNPDQFNDYLQRDSGLDTETWNEAQDWIADQGSSAPTPNIPKVTISKETKLPKISFAQAEGEISFPGLSMIDQTKNTILPKLSFASNSNNYSGLGGGIGGTIGALAAAYAVYANRDKCDDFDMTKTYTDYVINLQGETITVTGATGDTSTTRTVPSDAGELSLTLGGISPSWNFDDAELSSSETVGIQFTNNGLNSTSAKYGTFKVNATKHMHGYDPINGTSDDDYDIKCTNSNFGEYWIGNTTNDGSCTGITTGTYAQTYHLRFETGEQTDSGAYLDKSGSCTNGALTGNTGLSALPKVLLEWDWGSIDADTCEYGNPDYVYCDATQFTISLVKRLAKLNEFFRINREFGCPENPIMTEIDESMEEINSTTGLVPNGYIGVTDIDVSVVNDVATATVTISNLTGAAEESFIAYAWTGNGETEDDQYQWIVPAGESQLTFTANTPEWTDYYYFYASMSGEKGNRRAVTRAFSNFASNTDCWAPRTTRNYGGIPSIYYYLADTSNTFTQTSIENYPDFYDHISFKSYLMKDGFSDDFFNDFVKYYTTTLQLDYMTQDEKDVLNYLNTTHFDIVKRFTNETDVSAGLYDVKIYADFGEDDFTLINNGATDIETSLLLIKTPSVDSPFYDMPIDGQLGEDDGRQGYGSSYDNAGDSLTFNDNTSLVVIASTEENASSNTVADVTTKVEYNFEKINSSVGTRGQIAKISQSGSDVEIEMTPGYATPVIGKYAINSGTSGSFKFRVEKSNQPVNTGGNINYWTGAAKSIDFDGSYAVEVYNDAADSRIDGTDYGFEWDDISHNGTLYLKTFFYTPTDNVYALVAESGSFWTPDNEFAETVQLRGIKGMSYNSQANNSKVETIQDIFDFVANGDICVSNDGQTTSFWWNEYVLANTNGTINNQYTKEVLLAGSN